MCVITRPPHQAQHLRELIQSSGGQCILFPTLAIAPLPLDLQCIHQTLKHAQKIIFTSANAVPPVASQLLSLQNIPVFSVGPGTQKALREHHIEATIPETGEFNSEGLLKLPQLQSVKGQQILIFSGKDGRALLHETLRQRGASVTDIPVYQRIKPHADISILQPEQIDWIISTSQESLKNLWDMAGEAYQPWLIRQHLLVISPEMKMFAEALGCLYPPLVAANASDEAIIKVLFDKPAEKSQTRLIP